MTREDRLMERIEQGDLGAADELIELFYPEILRYCLWHAPNPSLAEDAVQESFLKVIRYFDRYTHKGKLRPFLYKVAANTCIDMQRKQKNPDISLEEIPTEPAGMDSALADVELRQLVCCLPEQQREIVLLRFGQDMSLREIAELVNLPVRTVQSRLRSALKRLKKEYEEGGQA